MKLTRKATVTVNRIDPERNDERALADMMKEARVMQLYQHLNIINCTTRTKSTRWTVDLDRTNDGVKEKQEKNEKSNTVTSTTAPVRDDEKNGDNDKARKRESGDKKRSNE